MTAQLPPLGLRLAAGVLHHLPPSPAPGSWLLQGLCPRGTLRGLQHTGGGAGMPFWAGAELGERARNHFPCIFGFPPGQLTDSLRKRLCGTEAGKHVVNSNGHWPSTPTRIKSGTSVATDRQLPPERRSGCRAETRPLCSGKTGRTGLQIGIFRSWFDQPNSCISLYLEMQKTH